MARNTGDRLIRFFSSYRIFSIIYLYQFTIQAFIRSIVPILTAANYGFPLRIKVLLLEVWFLLKASYGLLLRRPLLSEQFLGYTMRFPNYLEFVLLFIEIWGIQEYRLHVAKKRLKIIDCGSGWGMSVLYFKHFYPEASITAVEANQDTAFLLRENIKRNHMRKVVIRVAFVCGRGGTHLFYRYRGFGGWSVSDTGAADFIAKRAGFIATHVPSISLAELLRDGGDVVKLDIEGMEGEALESAQEALRGVGQVIAEYHPAMNRRWNGLLLIQNVLSRAGFRISLRNTKSLFPTKNALRMLYAVKT